MQNGLDGPKAFPVILKSLTASHLKKVPERKMLQVYLSESKKEEAGSLSVARPQLQESMQRKAVTGAEDTLIEKLDRFMASVTSQSVMIDDGAIDAWQDLL